MRRVALIVVAVMTLGCAHTVVFRAHERLSHEETVERLRPIIDGQLRFDYPVRWRSPTEERISPTLTRIAYQGDLHAPEGLATAPAEEVLTISIDTSATGEVNVTAEATLRGSRQYATGEWAADRLRSVEGRANSALAAPPKGLSPASAGIVQDVQKGASELVEKARP